MKHAILITAHSDPDLLRRILRYYDDDFLFYIHVDKASWNNEWTKLAEFSQLRLLTSTYRTRWGGHSILASSLYLLKTALKEEASYFHLISGADIPVRELYAFKQFFEQQPTHSYLEQFPLPDDRWKSGGFDRMHYFHFNKYINALKMPRLLNFTLSWQKRLGFSRNLPPVIEKFYGGSGWWSLSLEAAQHIQNYTEAQPSFFHFLKFSAFPEELYVPTVLMNSNFADSVHKSIRYIRWIQGNASPKVLTLEDFDDIANNQVLFGRKVQSDVSEELMQQLGI